MIECTARLQEKRSYYDNDNVVSEFTVKMESKDPELYFSITTPVFRNDEDKAFSYAHRIASKLKLQLEWNSAEVI